MPCEREPSIEYRNTSLTEFYWVLPSFILLSQVFLLEIVFDGIIGKEISSLR